MSLRFQWASPSNIVHPSHRWPVPPWVGCPVGMGTSERLMPTRSTLSALAGEEKRRPTETAIPTAANPALKVGFMVFLPDGRCRRLSNIEGRQSAVVDCLGNQERLYGCGRFTSKLRVRAICSPTSCAASTSSGRGRPRQDRRDSVKHADDRTGASGKRPTGQYRPPPPPIGSSSNGIGSLSENHVSSSFGGERPSLAAQTSGDRSHSSWACRQFGSVGI